MHYVNRDYFIFLFKYLNPTTGGSERINVKERKKKERQMRKAKKRKGIEAPRVKNPTQYRAINALIGDEYQNGKQKRTKRNPEKIICDYF